LRVHAANPTLQSRDIPRLFGLGPAAFFACLGAHDELWAVYEEARRRAGHRVTRGRLHVRRGGMTGDDLKIVEAITGGARTDSAIAAASGVDSRVFASRLYNLENEKHEIWSMQIGRPPVTHYFLRGEEPAQAKGVAE